VTVEEEVGSLLVAQGLTLATAESCTGGLVAHRITNVPGSSAYYLGGFVAYADEAKEALLGVHRETLLAHGAVGEETAEEMAQGARHRLGADVGVSVTGIAGPTGGTVDKPVGLVYIALSAPDTECCERHLWQGSRGSRCDGRDPRERLDNKEQSAEATLRLLLGYLRERAGPEGRGRMTAEFVNETVSVEIQLRRDETVRPVAFVWRGQRFKIASWGRESTKEQNERTLHCHLVQTSGGETWELCQDTEAAQWTLTRHWAGKLRIA
jgi:nicotinamide-nucleotide amidase